MSVVTVLRKSLSWDTTISVFFQRCRYSCAHHKQLLGRLTSRFFQKHQNRIQAGNKLLCCDKPPPKALPLQQVQPHMVNNTNMVQRKNILGHVADERHREAMTL